LWWGWKNGMNTLSWNFSLNIVGASNWMVFFTTCVEVLSKFPTELYSVGVLSKFPTELYSVGVLSKFPTELYSVGHGLIFEIIYVHHSWSRISIICHYSLLITWIHFSVCFSYGRCISTLLSPSSHNPAYS